PPWPPLDPDTGIGNQSRAATEWVMLVLTSRYGEETALRALRYFASFAFNVSSFSSGFLAQSSQSTAKLAASGGHGGPPLPASSFFAPMRRQSQHGRFELIDIETQHSARIGKYFLLPLSALQEDCSAEYTAYDQHGPQDQAEKPKG